MENGFCIWLTGLSGSGKTTIANKLVEYFDRKRFIETMDGDEIRQGFEDIGKIYMSQISLKDNHYLVRTQLQGQAYTILNKLGVSPGVKIQQL